MIFNIFDRFGVDTCKIELLESIENINKANLLYRERYYIESLYCVNKNRPIISETERKEADNNNNNKYRINNADQIKEYRENNKEKMKIYQKEYREIIKNLKKNSLEIRYLFKELRINF